jgi:hypothetical protein
MKLMVEAVGPSVLPVSIYRITSTTLHKTTIFMLIVVRN